MKRAIGYARYSSDNQTENSIEAQVSDIKKWCHDENAALDTVYIDRAETGTNTDREQFQEMLLDIRVGSYDYVVFHKSDRLARNRIEAIMTKKEIRKTGAEVVFVVGGNYDVETPEGMMLESLTETLDEYYSMNLSRETKKGLNNLARKGYHTGGLPPYGYDLKDKEYVINPVQAKAVKLVFELFNQGYGYLSIAEELNAQGFKTRHGRDFSKTSIYEIVRNEKYTGTMVFNKFSKGRRSRRERDDVIKIENAFEPIISKDTFLKVQEVMNKRVKPRINNNRAYILTGKVQCECGAHMVGNQYGRAKYRYFWYSCTNKRTKKKCDMKDIKAEELELKALEILIDDIFNEDFIKEISVEAKEYFENTKENNNDEKRLLLQKKATAEIYMNKELDLYLDELITKEQLKERTQARKHEIEVIDRRLDELKKDSRQIDIESLVKEYVGALNAHEVFENKKLALALIDEFMVSILIDSESIKFTYKVGDPYPFLTLAYTMNKETHLIDYLNTEITFI